MDNINDRYAAPQARVQDVGSESQPGELVLADRGVRFVASLVDGLIVMALFWVISLATPWDLFEPDAGITAMVGLGLIGIGTWAAVHGYLLATRSQTIGKMLFKIKIVRTDGSQASAVRMIGLRYMLPTLINFIPFLGNVFALVNALFIFRESRKCLHDDIADTIVVKL